MTLRKLHCGARKKYIYNEKWRSEEPVYLFNFFVVVVLHPDLGFYFESSRKTSAISNLYIEILKQLNYLSGHK